MSRSCFHPKGEWGPASMFSKVASPYLQKSPPSPGLLHNPGHFWFQTFSRMILEKNKTRNALVHEQLRSQGEGPRGRGGPERIASPWTLLPTLSQRGVEKGKGHLHSEPKVLRFL